MRWWGLMLTIVAGGVFGALAAFLVIVYFPEQVIQVQPAAGYKVLRDLTTIVIALVSVLCAIAGIVLGLVLHHILTREVRESVIAEVRESGNTILARLYIAASALWGQLHEHFYSQSDRTETPGLIDHAIREARLAADLTSKLNQDRHWLLVVHALNNLLMALAVNQDVGDRNEAHKIIAQLDRILKKRENELDADRKNSIKESILFARWRLPRHGSSDTEDARNSLEQLKSSVSPALGQSWERRWQTFGTLSQESNQ